MPSAVIRFLESDSETKVIAKPQLRGAEGKELLLNLGENQLGEAGEKLVAQAREQFSGPKVAIDALAGKIEMEIGQLGGEACGLNLPRRSATPPGATPAARRRRR